MSKCRENIYKVYIKILFYCSNINTHPLLSSNRVKLEKW
jgi:hypothetical protein